MSSILGRLREYFGDPLITPVGRRMELTTLGRSLVDPVNELLIRIDATLGTKPEFVPSTTQRRFQVIASDYTTVVLLVDVLRRLHEAAPGVTLEIRQPGKESQAQLEAGEIDLLVTPEAFASAAHLAINLFEDRYCAVVDRDHPDIGNSISLAQYLQQGHVSYESAGKPFFESWFERVHGDGRRVQLITPSFALLPQFAVGTQLVATLHVRFAALIAPVQPVRVVRLDFETPRPMLVLQWHRARDLDPGIQWLREVIADSAAALPALPTFSISSRNGVHQHIRLARPQAML